MALTKRLEKGAALTAQEHDDNIEEISQNSTRIEDLENQILNISSGNGKAYETLLEAQSVTPVPSDYTIFQVNESSNEGFHIYLASESGGTKFYRSFEDHETVFDPINDVDAGTMKSIANWVSTALKKVSNISEIPVKSSALFWLNGEIKQVGSNYYFVDQSGNGRDFLITNYDFQSSWIKGFPYKSLATISAPVGDSVLQGADVNNFLYSSGGVPNQIPVIALFENIDFANKLFSRHIQREVDENEMEIKEPAVEDIVLYSNVLTDVDLALAENYFNVPEKDSTLVYVSPTGNDTSGDGTYSNPYATPNKAYSVSSSGTIYILTGEYPFTTTTRSYFRHEKNVNIKGIGNVVADNNASPDLDFVLFCTSAASGSVISGIYFKTSTERWNLSSHDNVTFDRVKAESGTTSATRSFTASLWVNCLFTGGRLSDYMDNVTFRGCLVKSNTTSNVFEKSTANNLTIHYNKIIVDNGSNIFRSSVAGGILDVKGNTLEINNNIDSIYSHNNSPATIKFKSNKLDTSITFSQAILFNLRANSIEFENNRIYLRDISSSYNVIEYSSTTDTLYKNNLIITYSRGNVSHLKVVGDTTITGCVLENNKSITYGNSDIVLLVGSDGSTAYDNNISGIVIEKNYVKNVNGGANNGIFVGFNLDAKIRYNFILGHPHAIVYKHNDVSSNNTEGLITHNLSKGGTIISFGIPNNKLYNNSVFMDANESIDAILLSDNPTLPLNCEIKNNVVFAAKRKLYSYKLVKFLPSAGVVVDYNAYFQEADSPAFVVDGVNKTFSELQGLGFDTNSLNDIEVFFDDSLRPRSSESVCIGAGTNLGSNYDIGLDLETDWGFDNEIPIVKTKEQTPGYWDIGAYVL